MPEGAATLKCSRCGGALAPLETVQHNKKTKQVRHFAPCKKLPNAVTEYMAEIGRRGGKSRSEAKKTATRTSIAHANRVRLGRLRDGNA